jgi:hypothetical protein
MVSLQHFNKLKKIFDVEDVEQLRSLVDSYVELNKDQHRSRYYWDYSISPIEKVLDMAQIGIVK